jgi:putative transposase
VVEKKLPSSVEGKRAMIEPSYTQISVRRQCELIGLSRSSLYYTEAKETEFNLHLMRLIDEQYTRMPFYGWPRMTAHLKRQGYEVNHKRVQRLMSKMGLEAIYPRPHASTGVSEHKIYPYLLRDVEVTHPNQVWSADITYVPMVGGFMYLVAVIDWFSRYVLSWELSNTLDGEFCVESLRGVLRVEKPEIFNTDQGAQFTARAFTSVLEELGVQISMDGRGRALDNVFVERLWRGVKYEDIYLNNYSNVPDLELGLENYFRFYNNERVHQSLGYHTPAEIHVGYEKCQSKIHLSSA